ncbi:hypothetical protein GCM10010271_22670 [Streptomyces kurssanovii]|nr:hypothetical protein GCM10010271_22670 [Streptomyces kurssanovii]
MIFTTSMTGRHARMRGMDVEPDLEPASDQSLVDAPLAYWGSPFTDDGMWPSQESHSE